MRSPIIVSFTEAELWQLTQIAEARGAIKRKHSVQTLKRDPSHDDKQIDLGGIKAEYAVAHVFGVPFDMRIHLSGDDGNDLFLSDGRSVQVKYTFHRHGRFIIKQGLRFSADIGIMVVPGEGSDIHLVGWIGREEFESKAVPMDFGHGPNRGVTQAALRSMSELVTMSLDDYHQRLRALMSQAEAAGVNPWQPMRRLWDAGFCRTQHEQRPSGTPK